MKAALLFHFQRTRKVQTSRNPVSKPVPLQVPPSGPPIKLPRIIRYQLAALSRRTLMVAWAGGTLWIIISIGTLLLLQTGADWLFDFSWITRLWLLLGDAALLICIIAQHFARPWLQRLRPEQAALVAEKHWPELCSSVISVVQLSQKPEGSRFMVEQLIEQVRRKLETMAFSSAVNTQHLWRRAALALLLSATVAGIGYKVQPGSLILLARAALSSAPLPTQTVVIPISGDFQIPVGQTVQLEAKAKGVLPRAGRVEIIYPGKPKQTVAVTPKPSSPELFSLTMQNIQQPFTYCFHLGDGRGMEYKIQLIQPPVMESVKFEQVYPTYTGLASTQHSAGNLTLLAGSILRIEGHSNRPVKTATIKLDGLDRQIEMKITGNGKLLRGEISVPVNGFKAFSIVLKDAIGIESLDNVLYQVTVTPDKPPVITAAPGPANESLLTSDSPRLQFAVQDDFAVKEVFLCCEISSQSANGIETAPQIKRIPIPVSKPAGSLTFDYELKNPGKFLPWTESSTINYWLEAADNNDITGPGIGRTPANQWTIVSIAAKRQALLEKMQKCAESIDDISQTQETIRRGVGTLLRQQPENK